jgi:Putative motility protein
MADIASLAGSLIAAQAGNVQSQIAAAVLRSNLDAEKSSVLTILGVGEPSAPSLANVGPGVGGNINVKA